MRVEDLPESGRDEAAFGAAAVALHVSDEMDGASLPRAGEDTFDRFLEALVLIGHRETHPRQPSGAEPAQELEPERLALGLADIDADHLTPAGLVRGDDVALEELYDRYGRVAYGLAHRVLRDQGLAEDAVQEGFMAVWRTAGRFIPERAKASTWLLTLVHRRAVDLVRREERRRTEPLTVSDDVSDETTDELVWLRLQRERVQAALRQLPDHQREAIELAYYGGFTQSELADRLGQPLGTIKSRMFNGLSRLRELLDDPVEEEQWTPR